MLIEMPMALERTETLQLDFPLYKKEYESLFFQLTGSRTIIPTHVEVTREGKKDIKATKWTWKKSKAEITWKNEGSVDFHRTVMVQPSDDLTAMIYAFYDDILKKPSCSHSGSLKWDLTYKNNYIERESSLVFSYQFTEVRSSQRLTKRIIEMDIIEKPMRGYMQPIEIAQVVYDEESGFNLFMVSDVHIRRNSIGAIKGFLQQEDASYGLREPVPKDLYDILTDAAKILGE